MEDLVNKVHDWVNPIQLLGAALVLGLVQLSWAAVAARQQQGLKWARGARDEERPVTGMAARLERAFRNYMETFPLFAAGVLAAYALDKGDGVLIWWGSVLYVGARIVYVPLYAWGVPGIRSLVWFVSVLGLISVIAALFLSIGAT
jgi:uncharacterized MAPEG superfamily protein